jgi:purine-nucleoside phosphorylase
VTEVYTLVQIDEIVESIRSHTLFKPRVGIILGSGLGTLAAAVDNAVVIPYHTLPHWPVSTAIGHEGNLVVGQLEDQAVAIMQGRIHYYEGYSMAQVTLPVRVFQRSGLEILIVTNAAGAINPEYMPGDLMLIKDHLSLIAMTGPNPLRGPNLDELGPRFPDMSQAYDRRLRGLARAVATDEDLLLRWHLCWSGWTIF